MKAAWNGTIVADSDATRVVEGNHYFPPNSLKRQYFQDSKTTTVCPWKGTASYYTIEVGGSRNEDAAWHYPTPKEAAAGNQGLRRVLARRRGHRVAAAPSCPQDRSGQTTIPWHPRSSSGSRI